jgi:hypothetical protein
MPSKHQLPGCRVTGRSIDIAGAASVKRLLITPEQAQIYAGTVYSAEQQIVPVAADGAWTVRLPPGRYQFQIGDKVFTVQVPFGVDSARFSEIISCDYRSNV